MKNVDIVRESMSLKNKENKVITLSALIITIIILIIIASGISVYATATYMASQVTYKDGKTVEQALNDLYLKTQTLDNCKYFEFNHEAKTQFNYDFGFVPNSFIAFLKISSGEYITISLNTVSNGLMATGSGDNNGVKSSVSVNSTKLVSTLNTEWKMYNDNYTIYVFATK